MDGLMMKYFVLKPKSNGADDIYAEASRKAMLTYSKVIEEINPILAQELKKWVTAEKALANEQEGK